MQFTKIPFVANFSFVDSFDPASGKIRAGSREFQVSIKSYQGDIHHIQVTGKGVWEEDLNLVPLTPPEPDDHSGSLVVDKDFKIQIVRNKKVVLESDLGFGVMGQAALFAFKYAPEQQFFGLGEKTFGSLEVRHKRTRFWNVDALGDFHHAQWQEHPADPYYASVPYLIVQNGETFVGLLYHNPFPSWMDTGSDPSFFGTEDQNRKVVVGADDGMPSLWIIVGPTLRELTQKLQKLVGTTRRPPLWALGYHQCRWEYKGEEHLRWLNENMSRHEIPNDGLWLDIDYMKGYRVFTYDKEAFPSGPKKTIEEISKSNRKVVPILDPGIKLEKGNPLYEDGLKEGVFCMGPESKPYVGFVWPGETVFPDFAMEKGRKWWAAEAKKFLELGFGGAWVDMNDPSTGAIDPDAMLFCEGKYPHGAFRNQYALGMQMATFDGFQAAAPNKRVFILSRSGYTGTSRYSALWTGDNVSNRFYLRGSIPTTLNLSLSGIPFNGPDIGGFIGNTTPDLMADWTKAGFLFPFYRNHSGSSTRRQEPWAFSKPTLRVIQHYTRLRYKLLPYLYQLFIENEVAGDPMLRPTTYHYPDAKIQDHAFMVGRDILQTPFVDSVETQTVQLPGRHFWWDARSGNWLRAGNHKLTNNWDETPLFVRDGAIIPTLVGDRKTNEKDLRELELQFFLKSAPGMQTVVIDDGESLDYQKGVQSSVMVTAKLVRGYLDITAELGSDGYGKPTLTGVFYGEPKVVRVNGKRVRTSRRKFRWTGRQTVSAVSFPIEF